MSTGTSNTNENAQTQDVHQRHDKQKDQVDNAKDQKGQEDKDDPKKEPQRLFAELLGTFFLTFVAAGADVYNAIGHGQINANARLIAPGLLVMAMIYVVGGLSGAHFNPVVTLAFAIRRDFPWKRVPGYILAQLLGAILAALILRSLFGLAGHLGETLPHAGTIPALVTEILLTFILITVILGTATNHSLIGHNAALAVGATIALDGMFAYTASGASMNPARSLGPFIVAGQLGDAWIYIVGPLAGGLLAVIVAYLLRGRTTPQAVETASGD
jgi:aquaporin Z